MPTYLQTNNILSATSNELEIIYRLMVSSNPLNQSEIQYSKETNFCSLQYRTLGHALKRFVNENRIKEIKIKGNRDTFQNNMLGVITYFKNVDTARYNLGTTKKAKEKLVDILPSVIDDIYDKPFTENKIFTCISLSAKSIEIEIKDDSYLIKTSVEIESKNDNLYSFNLSLSVKKSKIEKSLLEIFQYLVILQYGLRWRNTFSGYEFEQFQKRVLKKFTNPKLKKITESVLFLQNKISGVTQRTPDSMNDEGVVI